MSGTLHHLGGTVGETLENLAEHKPAAMVVAWLDTDGCWVASWSRMTLEQLVFAHRQLGIAIDARLTGERPLR